MEENKRVVVLPKQANSNAGEILAKIKECLPWVILVLLIINIILVCCLYSYIDSLNTDVDEYVDLIDKWLELMK